METITTDPKPIEISNEPLITVIRKCRSLRFADTPTHLGALTTASPVYIITKSPTYLPSIRQIHLQNQPINPEGITLLSDARPLANILEGVQSALPGGGVGLTLTSLEGTRVHHSSYIVALGGNKLKFEECFAPNWDVNKGEQPGDEAVARFLAGAHKLPNFWKGSDEASDDAEDKVDVEAGWETENHSEEEEGEGGDGIHHVEIVKGEESEGQKLSDDLILDLTDAVRKLYRSIVDFE
ncbi:uncharacterized protein DFL_006483 [Arthrobotrys flagrans]|uniref:Uncharacterized protein n=1 Tax=Arthrobotrys flagrans TaxID=97331 RepID=A0A437A0H6_ARTFL|nr:hypothetical protein DFL_006483 [Arthrobotrys flagrans]